MKKYILFFSFIIYYSSYTFSVQYQLLKSNSTSSIAYLFAHGLAANQTQAIKLFKPHIQESILYGPTAIFDFPDAKKEENDYHAKYVNLGQTRDIQCLVHACNRTRQKLAKCEGVVLVGVSRGSAAILNYAALYKNAPIKAIIAEAPFDHLKSIVNHLLKRFHLSWMPFSEKIGMSLAAKRFPDLNINGLFPLNTVSNINKNIPILLVHSQKDAVIPITSVYMLYRALRASGHNHVYLFEIPSGDHGKLMFSRSALAYQNVVHAFYKKYDLPHHVQSAHKGERILKYCQPTMQEITYRLYRKSIKLQQILGKN